MIGANQTIVLAAVDADLWARFTALFTSDASRAQMLEAGIQLVVDEADIAGEAVR